MDDTPTIVAARRFLRIACEGSPPSEQELARELDQLAIAYHHAPEGEPAETETEPLLRSDEDRRSTFCRQFPDFGFYAVADPTETIDESAMVGDAIDDLGDIARDLEEVIWRFENNGADDAHWYFKLLYRSHWGRHMRELSHYLHARLF